MNDLFVHNDPDRISGIKVDNGLVTFLLEHGFDLLPGMEVAVH